MALTWSTVSNMVKTQYLPVVVDVIRTDDYIQRYIDKFEKIENVNYKFTKPYRYSYSEGTRMMPDYTGKIATPAETMYKDVSGTVKYRTGSIKIYKAIAKLMDTDKKAFINELKNEVKGITEAMKAEALRMAYGDAGYTPLATCAADATTSTASPLLITLMDTNKFLRPGMPVDFIKSGEVVADGAELYIKDMVGRNQFTVKTPATGAALTALLAALDGAHVFHAGGYHNETFGMKSLVGTNNNTVLGVDRSAVDGAWFRPNVYHMDTGNVADGGATGTLSDWDLIDIEQLIQTAVMRNGADKNTLRIFTTPGIEKYAVSLYRAYGEANIARETVDLWPYKTISIDNVPLLSCYHMPESCMYIPDMDGFVRFENMKLEFDEMGNGSMWKWVQDYAAYTAWLMEAFEVGHWEPWKCTAIYDMQTKFAI